MGSARQGNCRFEYMGKGGEEGCFYFGTWEAPTRKVLCNLGRRLHVASGEVVEKMRGVDASRGKDFAYLNTLLRFSPSY